MHLLSGSHYQILAVKNHGSEGSVVLCAPHKPLPHPHRPLLIGQNLVEQEVFIRVLSNHTISIYSLVITQRYNCQTVCCL